jgi:GNAT superfamily N-acetyltransferase
LNIQSREPDFNSHPWQACVTKELVSDPEFCPLNLLSRAQGRGIGSRLLTAWLDLAAKRGAAAVHVGVNRANQRALRFWRRNGFEDLKLAGREEGRTVWMGRS